MRRLVRRTRLINAIKKESRGKERIEISAIKDLIKSVQKASPKAFSNDFDLIDEDQCIKAFRAFKSYDHILIEDAEVIINGLPAAAPEKDEPKEDIIRDDLVWLRKLRKDYLRLKQSGELEKLGKQCANCRTCENIEYHHIVPLKLGGTNNISNIAPLCHACHEAAHQGRHMRNYSNNTKAGGRPHKVALTEETEVIFWRFYKQEIGAKEMFSLLGLRNKTNRGVNEIPAYIEFLRKHNLKHRKNLVDLHEALLIRDSDKGVTWPV